MSKIIDTALIIGLAYAGYRLFSGMKSPLNNLSEELQERAENLKQKISTFNIKESSAEAYHNIYTAMEDWNEENKQKFPNKQVDELYLWGTEYINTFFDNPTTTPHKNPTIEYPYESPDCPYGEPFCIEPEQPTEETGTSTVQKMSLPNMSAYEQYYSSHGWNNAGSTWVSESNIIDARKSRYENVGYIVHKIETYNSSNEPVLCLFTNAPRNIINRYFNFV